MFIAAKPPVILIHSSERQPVACHDNPDSFIQRSPLAYDRARGPSERLFTPIDIKIANSIIFNYIDRLIKHSLTELEPSEKSKFDAVLKALEVYVTKNTTDIFKFLIGLHERFFPKLEPQTFYANVAGKPQLLITLRKSLQDLNEVIFTELQKLTREEINQLLQTSIGKALHAAEYIAQRESSSKPIAIDQSRDLQLVATEGANNWAFFERQIKSRKELAELMGIEDTPESMQFHRLHNGQYQQLEGLLNSFWGEDKLEKENTELLLRELEDIVKEAGCPAS